MKRFMFIMSAMTLILLLNSCNSTTKETIKISEKYPNAQVTEQYAVSLNGESLIVKSAVINDTLIAISTERDNTTIDKNLSKAIIFAKDPNSIQEQKQDGLELKCDENKTWIFYATLGSPTEEQIEPQSTGYYPTRFIVVSDYIDYNGTIYKHE